jgi:hypothetical protein
MVIVAGLFAMGNHTAGFRCQGRPAGCALEIRWHAVLFCMPNYGIFDCHSSPCISIIDIKAAFSTQIRRVEWPL